MRLHVRFWFLSFLLVAPALSFAQEPSPTPSATPSAAVTEPVQETLRPEIKNQLDAAKRVRLGVALDIVAPIALENSGRDDERTRVRNFDLDLAAALDEKIDAFASVSGHDETGLFEITLHQGFLSSSTLIPRTSLKVGKYLLGFGRLNRLRQFEWPFTSPPRVQELFFSSSNALDTGLEGTVAIGSGNSRVTLGVANGYWFGHSHGPTSSIDKPLTPTHYVRPATTWSLGSSGSLDFALDYIGRTDATSELMRIVGFDLEYLASSTPQDWRTLAEFYHRHRKSSSLPVQEDFGGYVFVDRGIAEKVSAGLRAEIYSIPTLSFTNGQSRKNFDYGLAPVATYSLGDRSYARVSYTYLLETREGDSNRAEQKIEFQFVAAFGEF